MRDTWNEEPEKRPSFTDIVKLLHEQNVEDTLIDDGTDINDESDSGYLDVIT